MCPMSPAQVKFIYKTLGLSRRELAELLLCSVKTTNSYRSDCKTSLRNMPKIRQKILIEAFLKAGGKLKDLENIE